MSEAALRSMAWPADRLGEAIEELARRAGFLPSRSGSRLAERSAVHGPADSALSGDASRWIESCARRLHLEAEPVDAAYGESPRMLLGSAPALLLLPGSGSPELLLVSRSTRRGLVVLTPDLVERKVDAATVLGALRVPVEPSTAAEVERALDRAGIEGRRREAGREALLRELAPTTRVGGAWVLRPAGSAGLGPQAREARLGRLAAALLGAHAAQFGLWIISWWFLGRAALEGRLDQGWLAGWGLLLLTLVPLHLASSWAAGILSIRSGALLKRRLLQGALALDPEDVRHLGAGQLLGRVIESDVIEQMALSGGLLAVTGLVEVLLSALVLYQGAGGGLHVALLTAWLAASAWLARRYHRRRAEWTDERLDMTNDLVERMVGHRTRLAQEPPERWSDGEDASLAGYIVASRRLDDAGARLAVLAPRGWFVLGLIGLAPAFIAGGRTAASLAVGIGGVLLAFQALRHLADGLERGAAAIISWKQVTPFLRAASRKEPVGAAALLSMPDAARASPDAVAVAAASATGPPLLDLREVTFRYPGRSQPVFEDLDLTIRPGDRVLLEGPSGGGKSTLGALLSGAREPGAGLVLLRGLDHETVGRDGWRRRVVLVPQFHENHVFLGTFAFNALMGRGWPPVQRDFEEAESVCRALGLGPLLERMPAGMLQLVGETGWQLSHGERSRLFIARALLQDADAMILDESFAALDPETLRQTLGFVLEKARTLVVIAHP